MLVSAVMCSAFKAHHSGTTFYFAAERQDDMAKYVLLVSVLFYSLMPSETLRCIVASRAYPVGEVMRLLLLQQVALCR